MDKTQTLEAMAENSQAKVDDPIEILKNKM